MFVKHETTLITRPENYKFWFLLTKYSVWPSIGKILSCVWSFHKIRAIFNNNQTYHEQSTRIMSMICDFQRYFCDIDVNQKGEVGLQKRHLIDKIQTCLSIEISWLYRSWYPASVQVPCSWLYNYICQEHNRSGASKKCMTHLLKHFL